MFPQAQSSEARTWAMYCHLSAFVGIVIPLGNIVQPLTLWLSKKNRFAFVDDHGKEAVNFQITVVLVFSILLLSLVVLPFTGGGFPSTLLGIPLLFIFDIIFTLRAAGKAKAGVTYRYPLTLRLIK